MILRPWCPCRPRSTSLHSRHRMEAPVGTAMHLATSTVRLSPATNLFFYVLIWAVCIAGIGIVLRAALRSKLWPRWTTQDLLIVAAIMLLDEKYNNVIGNQFNTT